MSVGVAEQAIEAPAGNVIDRDLPAPGIADQQVVAEKAEICRRQGYTPGRVQPRTVLQPLQQLAFGRELVHESKAREIEVVVLGGILLGIGHIQVPIDVLHVEGSKALWEFAIKERGATVVVATKIHGLEVGVVNLDAPRTNVRDVEEKRSTSRHLRDGRALVNGTGGGCGISGVVHDHECVIGEVLGINSRAPGYYGSIFCHEG